MRSAATALPIDEPPAVPPAGLWSWLGAHRGAVTIAGLLAFAGPLTFFTGALSVADWANASDVFRLGLWWLLYGAFFWCLLLLAGYACEQAGRRLGPIVRSTLWLLGAAVASALTNLLTAGRASMLIELGLVHSAPTMHLHGFSVALIMALLYFSYLSRSRGHERAAARLAMTQAAQRDARRRIVQARLQEVQARIDPQLLFEMLETLRGLYGRDPVRAERFLDELIVFLRAALPRLRDTSSSLLREAELAHAFVRLRKLADAADDDMAVEISPEVMHARFPPGVLLPLLGAAGGRGPGACRLQARRSPTGCRLTLSLARAPDKAALERARALLAEIHGSSARLEVKPDGTAVNIKLQVPYELA